MAMVHAYGAGVELAGPYFHRPCFERADLFPRERGFAFCFFKDLAATRGMRAAWKPRAGTDPILP
jgi:hypothetical protein